MDSDLVVIGGALLLAIAGGAKVIYDLAHLGDCDCEEIQELMTEAEWLEDPESDWEFLSEQVERNERAMAARERLARMDLHDDAGCGGCI